MKTSLLHEQSLIKDDHLIITPTADDVRPLDGFSNALDEDVVSRGTAVQTNLTGNPNFPNPPVDLAALKAGSEKLSALMAAALDGGKKVVAEKKKQREAVIKMLRLLGGYAEVTCKDDLATFKSSGFEPASSTKANLPPLTENPQDRAWHGQRATSGLAQGCSESLQLRTTLRRGPHRRDA